MILVKAATQMFIKNLGGSAGGLISKWAVGKALSGPFGGASGIIDLDILRYLFSSTIISYVIYSSIRRGRGAFSNGTI